MTIYTETLQAREAIGFLPIGLDEPYRVFISEDPKGFDGGDVNLMAYVGNPPVNGIDPWGLETCQNCTGSARVLQGNPDLVGKIGGFGVPVTAGSAAVIPGQWGGKAELRPYLGQISGTAGGVSFSGITDVIGSNVVPNVRDVLQNRNPGILILELPSSTSDLGVVNVTLTGK